MSILFTLILLTVRPAHIFYKYSYSRLNEAPDLIEHVDWETVGKTTSEQIILYVNYCFIDSVDKQTHLTILDQARIVQNRRRAIIGLRSDSSQVLKHRLHFVEGSL